MREKRKQENSEKARKTPIDAGEWVDENGRIMGKKLNEQKLAVLGAGKLGGILLRAYLRQGLFAAERVTATVRHAEKAAAQSKELGVRVTTDNRAAVRGADIVLLGVKPQVVGEVLQEIRAELVQSTTPACASARCWRTWRSIR